MRPSRFALACSLLAACGPNTSQIPLQNGTSEQGCANLFWYDGGSVGTALQVLRGATAAVNAWNPGLSLSGVSGVVARDGTDPDGGWVYTFSSSRGGEATVRPLPGRTVVAGDCAIPDDAGIVLDWRIDSPAALSAVADAGFLLDSSVQMQLLSGTDPNSPLNGIDPAWIVIAGLPDGGRGPCVVDAATGAFGLPAPDGGTDGGPGDGGTDGGADAGSDGGLRDGG